MAAGCRARSSAPPGAGVSAAGVLPLPNVSEFATGVKLCGLLPSDTSAVTVFFGSLIVFLLTLLTQKTTVVKTPARKRVAAIHVKALNANSAALFLPRA